MDKWKSIQLKWPENDFSRLDGNVFVFFRFCPVSSLTIYFCVSLSLSLSLSVFRPATPRHSFSPFVSPIHRTKRAIKNGNWIHISLQTTAGDISKINPKSCYMVYFALIPQQNLQKNWPIYTRFSTTFPYKTIWFSIDSLFVYVIIVFYHFFCSSISFSFPCFFVRSIVCM